MHGDFIGTSEEPIESLWVKSREQTRKDNVVVSVCYRPPDQEEKVGEAFFKQVEKASQSQVLVFMGYFNNPNIFWKNDTAGHKRSWRFLGCTEDNFLM